MIFVLRESFKGLYSAENMYQHEISIYCYDLNVVGATILNASTYSISKTKTTSCYRLLVHAYTCTNVYVECKTNTLIWSRHINMFASMRESVFLCRPYASKDVSRQRIINSITKGQVLPQSNYTK